MTTDLYSTELWQDGQEVATDKLNNGQRFVRAQLTDQILQTLVGVVIFNMGNDHDLCMGGQNGADPSARLAYAVTAGAGYLRQGSANNKIQLAPGTLLQKIANADGNDSTLVPFTFAGTEEWSLANGDATNPRVDLLQMALSYTTDTPAIVDFQDAVTRALTSNPATATKRRVLCTLSVKQGTPAATPRVPDPDAGFVPVGSVIVGNGWTTGGNAPIFGDDTAATGNAVVHDQRMPIRVRAYRADPITYKLVTAWALDATNPTVTSNNATNALFVPCPVTTPGRLFGIQVAHNGTIAVQGLILGKSSAIQPQTSFLTRAAVTPGASGAADESIPWTTIEANQTPSAGPGPILTSTTNKIGVPLWNGGGHCPSEKFKAGSLAPFDGLTLKIASGASGTVVGAVVFFIAEGL